MPKKDGAYRAAEIVLHGYLEKHDESVTDDLELTGRIADAIRMGYARGFKDGTDFAEKILSEETKKLIKEGLGKTEG